MTWFLYADTQYCPKDVQKHRCDNQSCSSADKQPKCVDLCPGKTVVSSNNVFKPLLTKKKTLIGLN